MMPTFIREDVDPYDTLTVLESVPIHCYCRLPFSNSCIARCRHLVEIGEIHVILPKLRRF